MFANADRALSGLVFSALLSALTLGYALWLILSRLVLLRRPTTPLAVRRVRVQRGLLTRSYLETESTPRRWIPVHFDPALLTLPTPTTVEAHGNPRKHRLVAVRTGDTVLYPSGRVRPTEPPAAAPTTPPPPTPWNGHRACPANSAWTPPRPSRPPWSACSGPPSTAAASRAGSARPR
ncbi:hypothetical protein ACFQV2_05860 [Actinokineospora soli]|uniref:Uncharacterized protein n=1 Tax=Actinokineospora soli TaxID=1048753 RepID=A0ABW2TKV5_9PSEU